MGLQQSRIVKWIHHAEGMLVKMSEVARTTLGGYRWETVIESTLEFLGLHMLTATQAQALSARLNQELSGFVSASNEQMTVLGTFGRFLSRGDPVLVLSSLEKLSAMTGRLDEVLNEYTRVNQPGGVSPLSTAGLPATAAPPLPKLPVLNGVDARNLAKELRGVYAHAVQLAEHAQKSVSGPHATNPFSVTSAVAGIHILVRWLRERETDLRGKLS